MKKLTLLIALVISASAYSQIVLFASQDARLATIGDERGNDAFTPNLNFGFEMRQNNGKYDIVLRPDIEYAGLAGGKYARFSANLGLNFREWVKDFEFTSTVGYGITHRFDMAFTGFGANFQTTYKLNKTVGVYLDAEFIHRNDLEIPQVRFSGKIGIKIYLNNL